MSKKVTQSFISHLEEDYMIGRADPPEAQQTIAPIFSFLNTRPLKWRAHIPITF